MPKQEPEVSSREAILTRKPPTIKDVVSISTRKTVQVEKVSRGVLETPKEPTSNPIQKVSRSTEVTQIAAKGPITVEKSDGLITVDTSEGPVSVFLQPLNSDSSKHVEVKKVSRDYNGVTLICKGTRIDGRYDMKVFGIGGMTTTVRLKHSKGMWYSIQ